MPGGDRTGPLGLGPMTGRAAGYCAGFGIPGYVNSPYGRGFWGWGRGRGGGRGRSRWFYAAGFGGRPAAFVSRTAVAWPRPVGPLGLAFFPGFPGITPQQEVDALKGRAEYFEGVLDGIRRRIDELTPKPPSQA
ncbi:MAG: DUF5320 domain-containing protein [Thermogutta sp.]|nr:DUF5320 domain-containing protein [Thermogutta sp.]